MQQQPHCFWCCLFISQGCSASAQMPWKENAHAMQSAHCTMLRPRRVQTQYSLRLTRQPSQQPLQRPSLVALSQLQAVLITQSPALTLQCGSLTPSCRLCSRLRSDRSRLFALSADNSAAWLPRWLWSFRLSARARWALKLLGQVPQVKLFVCRAWSCAFDRDHQRFESRRNGWPDPRAQRRCDCKWLAPHLCQISHGLLVCWITSATCCERLQWRRVEHCQLKRMVRISAKCIQRCSCILKRVIAGQCIHRSACLIRRQRHIEAEFWQSKPVLPNHFAKHWLSPQLVRHSKRQWLQTAAVLRGPRMLWQLPRLVRWSLSWIVVGWREWMPHLQTWKNSSQSADTRAVPNHACRRQAWWILAQNAMQRRAQRWAVLLWLPTPVFALQQHGPCRSSASALRATFATAMTWFQPSSSPQVGPQHENRQNTTAARHRAWWTKCELGT